MPDWGWWLVTGWLFSLTLAFLVGFVLGYSDGRTAERIISQGEYPDLKKEGIC